MAASPSTGGETAICVEEILGRAYALRNQITSIRLLKESIATVSPVPEGIFASEANELRSWKGVLRGHLHAR